MNSKNTISVVLLGAVFITALFHRQALGLNLLIAETAFFAWLCFTGQIDFKNRNHIISGSGFAATSIAVVLTHSLFSIIVNFISLFIFIGILIYPLVRSLTTAIVLSGLHIVNAQGRFINELSQSKLAKIKQAGRLKRSGIFILPVLVILIFISLYRGSNPVFDKLAGKAGFFVGDTLDYIFADFDFSVIITLLLSLFICNFIVFRTADKQIIKGDLEANDNLLRLKPNRNIAKFRFTALKSEYKAGIFLLLMLNILLLIVNVIDVYWVWFNFTWNGQYLKQFVHEGTYLLLISIICSIVIVLYFFRGNLNFFSKNSLLKRLCYIWLAQNAILTVSVAIRNWHYIRYFALAYKRIALIIFLLLTLYGLYTVFVKVMKGKSSFYLIRTNMFALYVLVVLASLINWDSLIVRYNFRNADSSFLDLAYMTDFSDKSLMYLDKSQEELEHLNKMQKGIFHFDMQYMTPKAYHDAIEAKKKNFIQTWESKNLLSWNLPEYLVYKNLKME